MMNAAMFLDLIASPLVEELKAIQGIKKFTTNSAVIGAHAEASVRRLVARVVHPLRISTGAVISEELCSEPRSVPQIDTIIWLPIPAPALFEVGEFGLVPRGSALAIMEIKRSAAGAGSKLKKTLDQSRVRKLVADDPPNWPGTDEALMYPDYPAMGVICLQESPPHDQDLAELIAKGHAVVLLEMKDDEIIPNTEAVHRLINFLIRARQRANAWDGKALVNLNALTQ